MYFTSVGIFYEDELDPSHRGYPFALYVLFREVDLALATTGTEMLDDDPFDDPLHHIIGKRYRLTVRSSCAYDTAARQTRSSGVVSEPFAFCNLEQKDAMKVSISCFTRKLAPDLQ
jgi:hypothetical protein